MSGSVWVVASFYEESPGGTVWGVLSTKALAEKFAKQECWGGGAQLEEFVIDGYFIDGPGKDSML